MTGGLCTDHFRIQLIEAKQREVDDLWDIYGMIRYRETLTERGQTKPVRSPTIKIDEEW